MILNMHPLVTQSGPKDLTGIDHYDVWTYRDSDWGKRQSSTGVTSTAAGDTVFVTARHMDGCQDFKPTYTPRGNA